jgi:hypothetical protein
MNTRVRHQTKGDFAQLEYEGIVTQVYEYVPDLRRATCRIRGI